MSESIEELTALIEQSCDKLVKKDDFSVDTYLDGLKRKYKTENKDFDDEKKEKTKANISLLTDQSEKRMCKRGHSLGTSGFTVKCCQCGTDTNGFCHSCHNYEKTYAPDIYDKIGTKYYICDGCAVQNSEKVKKELLLQKEKEREIIAYYEKNPHIAIDLLCNLNTKTALEFLLKEIVVSSTVDTAERFGYCLWSFDIDNFKDLNASFGHDGADNKLKEIGKILKEYTRKGEIFWKEKGIVIQRVFAFRPGGDEFCIVTKGYGTGWDGKGGKIKTQKGFYDLLKKEINGIGINISVGLLVYGGYLLDCTATNWLKMADSALYEAKDVKGKNALRICDGCGNDQKGKIVETFGEISIWLK